MFTVEGTHILGRVLLKDWLRRNALAGGGPHVRDVQILVAVAIVVQPTNAHARANVFYAQLRRDVRERSVAIVAVKVFAPKVVDHAQVRPAILVIVTPAAAKTVSLVPLIEAGLGGDVAERTVALIAHEEIGRPVLCVVKRRRGFVRLGPAIIKIKTKINIQPAVAIIVGNRCARERPLLRVGKSKSVELLFELAVAFVQKEQRAALANDNEVVAAIIVNIRKERASRIF